MFLSILRVLSPASARLTFGLVALLPLLCLLPPAGAHAAPAGRGDRHGDRHKHAPKEGLIRLTTYPGGYPVFIDGQNAGETADYFRAILISPGPHTIKILFPDTPWSQVINVEADHTYCIQFVYFPRTVTVPKMPASHCPYTVSVTSPSVVNEGDVVTFTADVDYQGPSALTYTWTVSPPAARTLSGAGTGTIAVDSSGLAGKRLTAVLVVDDGSGDRDCSQTARASTGVNPIPQHSPMRFDEFPSFVYESDNKHFDQMAVQLQYRLGITGYIIAYAGRRSRPGEADRMGKRAIDYLTATRGISHDRLVFVNGGYREFDTFELWLVPQGAEPPRPTRTHSPSSPPRAMPPRREFGSYGVAPFAVIDSGYGESSTNGVQTSKSHDRQGTVATVELGNVIGAVCDCGKGNNNIVSVHARTGAKRRGNRSGNNKPKKR
jgi:hypothetical protein